MTLPDPETFIGNACVITLKSGRSITRTVRRIDTGGVHVEEPGGGEKTLSFAEIALVRPRG